MNRPGIKSTNIGRSRKQVPILVGIVVAIILAGLFIPLPLGGPTGPPPRQPDSPPSQGGSPPSQQSTTQQTGVEAITFKYFTAVETRNE
jgi:hypothetical protein